jgi:hypothetical protein
VEGNRAYAGGGATSGLGGPLASASPGLDGLALTARSGPWRAQTAAAWNRLSGMRDPRDARAEGNSAVTVRRDAGLFAAGLARSPAEGPDLRAQAFLARLEAGPAEPAWLAVAGAQWSGRGEAWSGKAAAAVSAGSARPGPSANPEVPEASGSPAWHDRRGAFCETRLAFREPQGGNAADPDPGPAWEAGWGFLLRQAMGDWANPLQSPRLPAPLFRDTVGGWPAEAPGAGMARAETAFPLRRGDAYSAGLRATAAAGWAAARAAAGPAAQGTETEPAPGAAGGDRAGGDAVLTSGRGEAAWLQAYGPFTLSLGAGFGWRRPGSGEPSADAGRAVLEWREGPWMAQAAWARRASGYAGGRPMPLDFSLSRRAVAGRSGPDWSLGWSAADARRPWRAHRVDARQDWPGGNGIRVRQRLRLPWTGTGLGRELAYQLALEAEF